MPNVAALRALVSNRIIRLITLAVCVASCDDGSSPNQHIARVEVNLAPTLLVSTNASAVARAFDISGDEVTGVTPRWRSSRPEVVSIDNKGILKGLAVGDAQIIATIGGVSGSAPISIVPIPVASISITPGGGPIDRGQSLQLHATVRDQFGDPVTDRPVAWKSEFPGIAQVTAGGLVIAIAAGSTEITATSEGVSTSVTVTVVVNTVPSGPNIETITPAVLVPGIVAVIRGTNFGSTAAQNDVRVAGVPASVLSATPTELTVQLGASGYGCEPTRQVFVQVARGSAADAKQHVLQSAPQRTLAPGESVVLSNLSEAQCFELGATGGRYLLSVFNVTPNAESNASVSFTMRGAKGLIPPGVAAAHPAIASAPPAPAAAYRLHDVFTLSRLQAADDLHARLLEMNLARLRTMTGPGAFTPRPAAAVRANEPVGTVVQLKVPNITRLDYCSNNNPVSGRVVYNGTRAIIVEDVSAPFAGQMDTIFQKVGREFDDVMFDIVRTYFGDPLRMDDVLDNNGKIIMLFSPRINSLAGIVGFVVTCDFETVQTSPSSNRAEVFYAKVPTNPASDTANDETRAGWYRTMRSTILHEVKHIASFATRIRDFGNSTEESWLEEGSARIAEEIYARTASFNGLQQRGNADYASTLYCELRPSSPVAPQCAGKPYVMGRHFQQFYSFLADPETHSVLGPKAGLTDFSWYGSSWSMLRWAVDQAAVDEATFFQGLMHTSQAGVANLVARTGRPWEELLGEWSLTQYLDDLPGFVPANARLTFPSWNLRSIYAGLHTDKPFEFPATYPVMPHQQAFGDFKTTIEIVAGGGFSLFEISGAQTGRQLIQLQSITGGDPSPALRVSLARIN